MEELFASLVKDFVDETAPLVQEVSGLVLKLEEALATAGDTKPLLRGIRAGLHTLKGNSAMMGLSPIERVAHALEDLCAQIATSPSVEPGAQVQLLLEGCDLLGVLIQSAGAGAVDAGPADAFVRRAGAANETARLPTSTTAPAEMPVHEEVAGSVKAAAGVAQLTVWGTTTLSPPDWKILGTVPLTGGSGVLIDDTAPTVPTRFYRATAP